MRVSSYASSREKTGQGDNLHPITITYNLFFNNGAISNTFPIHAAFESD
jgi:hypothetical protein